jgi:aerobic carbon-monoxide dehydrogenase small subunit
MQVTFTVNGEERRHLVNPDEKLLDTLRSLGYTGVKRGCDEGTCGSCVVILNGKLVNSCVMFTPTAEGASIVTIEGLGNTDNPHLLQTQFVKAAAVQCGFCTPGMILAAKVLLDANPNPTDDDIKEALDGNRCRCTGYVKIIEAIHGAAKVIRQQAGEEVTHG